jgi:hypothetical protein
MCGGSPPPMPAQPTPQEEASAREWEAAQADARARRAAEERKAEEAAKRADDVRKWTSGKGTAYSQALDYGRQRMTGMGLDPADPYGLDQMYRQRIDAANLGLQELDDYSAAFSPSQFDTVYGEVRGGARNKLKKEFDTQLDPYYAEDRFGSTADDAILSMILGSQYDDARTDIGTARDRGQINQSVYDRALRDLDTRKSGANSELQGLGGGVLSSIIDDLNRRRGDVGNKINAFELSDTLDLGRESGRIRSRADERFSGLEGDIRTAVGDKQFFDTSGLIGKAAARVGTNTAPTSGTSNPLLTTFQDQTRKQNEGVF